MSSNRFERRRRRPYWRTTRWQMLVCVTAVVIGVLLVPTIIQSGMETTLLGFPIGYLVAAHGLMVGGFLLVVWFVRRQNAIDHWHGAHEDF